MAPAEMGSFSGLGSLCRSSEQPLEGRRHKTHEAHPSPPERSEVPPDLERQEEKLVQDFDASIVSLQANNDESDAVDTRAWNL